VARAQPLLPARATSQLRVPFAAEGLADLLARTIADSMNRTGKYNLIFINCPGAGAYRTRGSALAFGSLGVGSAGHLRGVAVARDLGIEAIHVPYNGSGLILQGILNAIFTTRLTFLGRADDLMVFNGIDIHPSEIETALRRLPGVRAVAAIPARHPVHQDVPVCAVVLDPGSLLEPRQILEWAKAELGVVAPRRIFLMDSIPGNEQGKLLRPELRRLLVAYGQDKRQTGRHELSLRGSSDRSTTEFGF